MGGGVAAGGKVLEGVVVEGVVVEGETTAGVVGEGGVDCSLGEPLRFLPLEMVKSATHFFNSQCDFFFISIHSCLAFCPVSMHGLGGFQILCGIGDRVSWVIRAGGHAGLVRDVAG